MADITSKKYHGACRVDFVGGTTDMWPLYCHMGCARVINMALKIGMNVEATLDRTRKFSLKVQSHELKLQSEHQSLEALERDLQKSVAKNPMRWIHRVLLQAFKLVGVSRGEWSFTVRSDLPPGSGLGGSSVLGVTLAKAVFDLSAYTMNPWALHSLIVNLESAEMEKPAGEQDYLPALYGGFLSISFSPEKKEIEQYSISLGDELASRCALLHTGKPHHSGINNWDVYKKYHDGNKVVRNTLHAVRDLADEMHGYLNAENLDAFVSAINREWKFRTKLSRTFNAPVLDRAWSYAKKLGATSRKACGAGGGGTLLVIFPDSKLRNEALLRIPPEKWLWMPVEMKSQGIF